MQDERQRTWKVTLKLIRMTIFTPETCSRFTVTLLKYIFHCRHWKIYDPFCLPLKISLHITRSKMGASCNVPDIVVRIKQISDSHNRYHYQIQWNQSNMSPTVYEDRRTWRWQRLRIATKRVYIKNRSSQHFTCDIISNRYYYFVCVMHD
jgi:hypothetical protein